MNFKGLTIAVPRESMSGERRVAVIPDTVQKFVAGGARVLVEKRAGEAVFYEDEAYAQAGAEIVAGAQELYRDADIILKVKEPQINGETGADETENYPEKKTLICFLHPANPANHNLVRRLAAKHITSFTLDSIPRISRAQQMDALTSMSTVAGYRAVVTAAYHLTTFLPLIPMAFGMLPPARVLIIGAGVAGLQAAATAKRMGAKVKALDIRPEANEQASSLGVELIPFDLPTELGRSEGGYARRLPEEWYEREREVLAPHVAASDVVILGALVPGEQAPLLLDKPMLENMGKGSVVVDISIDQGGNCELSRAGEEYKYQGIMISALANLPAYMPVASTQMFAQNVWHYLNYMVKEGSIDCNGDDEIIQNSLVTKGSSIVHRGTLEAMESCKS